MNNKREVKYEIPNSSNVGKGDILILYEKENGNLKFIEVEITGKTITGGAVTASYQNERGDEVNVTSPFPQSVIQKKDGKVLVGERVVVETKLGGLLRLLSTREK